MIKEYWNLELAVVGETVELKDLTTSKGQLNHKLPFASVIIAYDLARADKFWGLQNDTSMRRNIVVESTAVVT